jgi:hypothetical protein
MSVTCKDARAKAVRNPGYFFHVQKVLAVLQSMMEMRMESGM